MFCVELFSGLFDQGEHLTMKKLALELRDKINYGCSVSVMYIILKIIGFKDRKTNDGRHCGCLR
jgi:hypothetical protein